MQAGSALPSSVWYQQAGTPEVIFRGVYNEGNGTYTVELSQIVPDTPGQTDKKPMHIPVTIGLLDESGRDIKTDTLHLTRRKAVFRAG
ncbi:MAG: DUF3458 domain-containing protein [Alphaproteobacteria bacterium]